METRFALVMYGKDGVQACAWFRADIHWIAMDPEDGHKMGKFRPGELYSLSMADNGGSYRFVSPSPRLPESRLALLKRAFSKWRYRPRVII